MSRSPSLSTDSELSTRRRSSPTRMAMKWSKTAVSRARRANTDSEKLLPSESRVMMDVCGNGSEERFGRTLRRYCGRKWVRRMDVATE